MAFYKRSEPPRRWGVEPYVPQEHLAGGGLTDSAAALVRQWRAAHNADGSPIAANATPAGASQQAVPAQPRSANGAPMAGLNVAVPASVAMAHPTSAAMLDARALELGTGAGAKQAANPPPPAAAAALLPPAARPALALQQGLQPSAGVATKALALHHQGIGLMNQTGNHVDRQIQDMEKLLAKMKASRAAAPPIDMTNLPTMVMMQQHSGLQMPTAAVFNATAPMYHHPTGATPTFGQLPLQTSSFGPCGASTQPVVAP